MFYLVEIFLSSWVGLKFWRNNVFAFYMVCCWYVFISSLLESKNSRTVRGEDRKRWGAFRGAQGPLQHNLISWPSWVHNGKLQIILIRDRFLQICQESIDWCALQVKRRTSARAGQGACAQVCSSSHSPQKHHILACSSSHSPLKYHIHHNYPNQTHSEQQQHSQWSDKPTRSWWLRFFYSLLFS